MSEALRLAEIPSDYSSFTIKETQEAQAELRRLHAENEGLRAEVERITNNRDMWKEQCARQSAALMQMKIAALETNKEQP